jgi:hypothetical protein
MKKAAKSTTRGVVVIDKAGKVQVWEQAGPQKTVDAVMAYVQSNGSGTKSVPPAPASDTTMADAPPAVTSTEKTSAAHTSNATGKALANSAPETGPASAKEEPPKMDEVPITKEASAEEVEAAETAAEVGETAAKIDSGEEVKA